MLVRLMYASRAAESELLPLALDLGVAVLPNIPLVIVALIVVSGIYYLGNYYTNRRR